MLIIVEDRDVEQLAESGLDLEATRRGDVFEVDAGETRCDSAGHGDDLVDILGVQRQRPGIDAGEAFEQRRLALHHRQRRVQADVAQPEDR